MIHDISMSHVACFQNRKRFDFSERQNLIFGENGTGKTTIATYLYTPDSPIYKSCSRNTDGTENVFVYTKAFMIDNFLLHDSLNGIFTLSKENKTAEEIINTLQLHISDISQDREQLQSRIEVLQKNLQKQKTKVKDLVWEIKQQFAGTRSNLDFCLEGLKGDKDKLLDFVLKQPKPLIPPDYTFEDLIFEMESSTPLTNKSDSQIFNLLPEQELASIEQTPAWSQPIHSTFTNQEQAPWQYQGMRFLQDFFFDSAQNCPFCQQETISPTVASHLTNLLGAEYISMLDELHRLEQSYIQARDDLLPLQTYLQDTYLKYHTNDFTIPYCDILRIWDYNGRLIRAKLRNPSLCVRLRTSIPQIQTINKMLGQSNQYKGFRNKRGSDTTLVRTIIKQKFWELVRWDFDKAIQTYEQTCQEYSSELSSLLLQMEQLDEKLRIAMANQDEIFLSIHTIQPAIDRINTLLRAWNLDSFTIERYIQERSLTNTALPSTPTALPYRYQLKRLDSSDGIYSSLSTGEQQLISFLYFCESCKSPNNTTDQQKVIVIDDPTTGLSARYVERITDLIYTQFLSDNKEYVQVIILSHDRNFLEELGRRCGNIRIDELRKAPIYQY